MRVGMRSKHKKILVVDDEPDILEFLQELLKQEGYTVAITDKAEHVENLMLVAYQTSSSLMYYSLGRMGVRLSSTSRARRQPGIFR